jgi:hypothetical protein
VHYRCAGHRGRCGNTYIREEQLADLPGTVLERIQIPPEIADEIAAGISDNQSELEQERQHALSQVGWLFGTISATGSS